MSKRRSRKAAEGRHDGAPLVTRCHFKADLRAIWIKAAGVFLGGLLLLIVTQVVVDDADRTATPPATQVVARAPEPVPTFARTATPAPTATARPTPSFTVPVCPPRLDPVRGTPFIYRVLPGDTVLHLSSCFHVPQDQIMAANWIAGPINLLADTYIVIPEAASRGGADSSLLMLRDLERVVLDAFNASLGELFVGWPREPDPALTSGCCEGQALQDGWGWVRGVLDRYRPVKVLSASYAVNMPPVIADPDFGWQPWERGAYATLKWVIRLQQDDGTCMELTLCQSAHYGLGAPSSAPIVTRFASAMNRYPAAVVDACPNAASLVEP